MRLLWRIPTGSSEASWAKISIAVALPPIQQVPTLHLQPFLYIGTRREAATLHRVGVCQPLYLCQYSNVRLQDAVVDR
jgi:hypothetical protein